MAFAFCDTEKLEGQSSDALAQSETYKTLESLIGEKLSNIDNPVVEIIFLNTLIGMLQPRIVGNWPKEEEHRYRCFCSNEIAALFEVLEKIKFSSELIGLADIGELIIKLSYGDAEVLNMFLFEKKKEAGKK